MWPQIDTKTSNCTQITKSDKKTRKIITRCKTALKENKITSNRLKLSKRRFRLFIRSNLMYLLALKHSWDEVKVKNGASTVSSDEGSVFPAIWTDKSVVAPLFQSRSVWFERKVFTLLLMRPQQRRFLAVESHNLWSYNSSAELPSSAGPQETHTLDFFLFLYFRALSLSTHALPPSAMPFPDVFPADRLRPSPSRASSPCTLGWRPTLHSSPWTTTDLSTVAPKLLDGRVGVLSLSKSSSSKIKT